MQNPEETKERFLANTSEDVKSVLETEVSTNKHISHLNTLLSSIDTQEGRRAVADYGVGQIHETASEDKELASYFFVVSNLKIFSPEARSFFTDVMVYCEDDIGSLKSASAVREMYKKIRPAL